MVRKSKYHISNRLLYTLITISILVILGVGVYATTTISDSSISTSILNSTTDVFAYNNLNLTIPYYLATNGTFPSAASIWNNIGNGTVAFYNFGANNHNGTGYFNTSGQVNGSTVYSGLENLTIAYLLATNGTLISNAILNNGTYNAWANLMNGTMVNFTILNNGTYALYQFGANNHNGTGYFNTSGQVNGSTVYSGLENLTIAYLLATNGTLISNAILNNGTYNAWANLMNGTMVNFTILNNGSYSNIADRNNTFAQLSGATFTGAVSLTNTTINYVLNMTSAGPTSLPNNGTAGFCLGNGSIARNDSGVWGCQASSLTWKLIF
jgi:hypothetical protein